MTRVHDAHDSSPRRPGDSRAREGDMDLIVRSRPILPLRAWNALRTRGPAYAWHKVLRRVLSRHPRWKRQWLYADPRSYWTHRGGIDYFREQEGQPARSRRAAWIAEHVAAYQPTSILEIGCGYGKLLDELSRRQGVTLCGVDFSPTQLELARRFLEHKPAVRLVLSRGERLPFPDDSFDMVVTSAVILHNAPEVAETIRREVVRVARRFAAHNEETSESYNRFGYDTALWYRSRGIPLAESGPIPADDDPRTSQFCVALLDPAAKAALKTSSPRRAHDHA